MIRLGVWYVRWILESGRIRESQLQDALTRRVNLYRLTSLWDGIRDPASGFRDPEWDHLVGHLAALVRQFPFARVSELEELALARLRPFLGGMPERRERSPFGCWTYEVVGESITDGPGLLGRLTNRRKIAERLRRLAGLAIREHHAALHFFNASAPLSPFDDVRTLAGSLLGLIGNCRSRFPAVKTLWCQSWLNSNPTFLALFPRSWLDSAAVRTTEEVDRRSLGRAPLNTGNWWGQFMKSDGGFHHQRAQRFRESGGQFPYCNRLCHAGIDEIDDFLVGLLGLQGPLTCQPRTRPPQSPPRTVDDALTQGIVTSIHRPASPK
jgi:hypothetical protein